MADLVLVVGNSGSGKSSSLRNLEAKETFVFNVAGKPLPFKGFRKNYIPFGNDTKDIGNLLTTSSSSQIIKVMDYIDKKRPDIKQIIIDDANYIMSFESMDRLKEKGYDKFTELAQNFYLLLKKAAELRDDLKVFIFGHEENMGDTLNPKRKFKTTGRLVDSAIGVEGLCTYVLFTELSRNDDDVIQYNFITQTDGTTTAKSPMGCFDDKLIDNDLRFVIEKIDEYNEG